MGLWNVLLDNSVDIIIDNYGYDANIAIQKLRPGGAFVSLVHKSPDHPRANRSSFEVICNSSRNDDLNIMQTLVENGKLEPVVQESFSLDTVPSLGFETSKSGGVVGKLGVIIN